MNCAIYCRKSTDEPGRKTEDKSVERQEKLARAFALKNGWTVRAEHVYKDDDISGAEFRRRPDFQRLLAALTPKPPFQILIVSEQKSIGREMSETAMVIKQLSQAGVEIFEYVHGKSLTPTSAIEKFMSSAQGFADEDHRSKSAERVTEKHTEMVKVGQVVGGRVFGYDNRPVWNGVDPSGNPLRSHVVREINEDEAAVVQRIYELYDSGLGLKAIAKRLTSEKARAPRPFIRKDPTKLPPVKGWSPSTVRAVLSRERYRGAPVWNKSKKRDAWGQVDQKPRDPSEWVSEPEDANLAIVSDALWFRVESRRKETEGRAVRFESGRLSGRPPGKPTQNLLVGLATCALCGGGIVVETSPRKRGRVPEYICARRRLNGTCTNALRISVVEMNEAVLQAIEEHALTPEAVEQVIRLTERDDVADLNDKLARERKDIDKRIARLTAAIETGEPPASLVAKLRELETRRRAIDAETEGRHPVPRLAPAVIENRLAEWRRLLRQSTTQGRTVLQRILRGRLTFTPYVDHLGGVGYTFEGPTRFDKLFAGIASPRPKSLDPNDLTGTEQIGPEDTFDGDYGRLLDRFYAEGVASPIGTTTPVPLIGGPLPAAA